MTVNTKSVQGRRDVHYTTFDDLLADAEDMAASSAQTIGNWSLGQIFRHLAKAIHSSIDGASFRANWFVRFVVRNFLKKRFLTKGIPSGFQIPDKAKPQFFPEEVDTQTGLQELREAIERVKREPHRADHAVLGKLSREESDQFHLRHAEMHMSFAVKSD